MKTALLLAAALPAFAHHNFAAEFDAARTVKIEGTVAKIEWMNPHAWLYVDVTTAEGAVEHWQFEFGAPVDLIRHGWHRSDLHPGDHVTIEGAMAKFKEFTASARSILLPDGRRVFAGNAGQAPEGAH